MNSGLIISEFNSPPVIENPTGCEEGVSVDFGISYRPVPVSTGIGRGFSFGNYFIQFFSPTVDLDCICQNFIFVIDKSGSMGVLKMSQAKEAAEYLLNSLSDSDFFNVIAFDSVLYSFHNSLVSVGKLLYYYKPFRSHHFVRSYLVHTLCARPLRALARCSLCLFYSV